MLFSLLTTSLTDEKSDQKSTVCPPLVYLSDQQDCALKQPVIYLRSPCFHSNWTTVIERHNISNEKLYFYYDNMAVFVEPDDARATFPDQYLRQVVYATQRCNKASSFTNIIVAPACPVLFNFWYDEYVDYLVGVSTPEHGYLVLNPTVYRSSVALANIPTGELPQSSSGELYGNVADLRIINLNGDTSALSEVLYELLTKFEWESVCLLELRLFTGRSRGVRVAARSGCSDTFAAVEQQAFINSRDVNHLYWYFDNAESNETLVMLEQIWQYVKSLTRIIVLCGYPLSLSKKFIRTMGDSIIKSREYAVIYFDIFLGSQAVLNSISDTFPYIDITRSIKILTTAEDVQCRNVKWNFFASENVTSGYSPVTNYLQDGLHCALHYLTEAALYAVSEVDDFTVKRTAFLLQEFFKRYNKYGRLYRQNLQRRSVDYLKNWTLLSFDAKAMTFLPVINLSWTISVDVKGRQGVKVTLSEQKKIIWASGATVKLDGSADCWGYPNFYACEKEKDYTALIVLLFMLSGVACLTIIVLAGSAIRKYRIALQENRKAAEGSCFISECELSPSNVFGTLDMNKRIFLAAVHGEEVLVRCVGTISNISKVQPEQETESKIHIFCSQLLQRLRLIQLRQFLSRTLYNIAFTLLGVYDSTAGIDFNEEKLHKDTAPSLPADRPYLNFNKQFLQQINDLKSGTISEENIATFKGLLYLQIDRPKLYFVYEYCPMGSLTSLLGHVPALSSEMKYLLAYDIINGLHRLHYGYELVHGHLRASSIQIDGNCRAKILITQLETMDESVVQTPPSLSKLYLAPEMLRNPKNRPTREADMYSFGILLHQIIYQQCAFYIEKEEEEMERKYYRIVPQGLVTEENFEKINAYCMSLQPENSYFTMYPEKKEADLIVQRIVNGDTIRPSVMPTEADMKDLLNVMQHCWKENPRKRMDCACAHFRISMAMKMLGSDPIYGMGKTVSYAAGDLESIMVERTNRVQEQRDHCLRLLRGIMPLSIASKLMSGYKCGMRKVELASIYFHGVYNFKRVYTTAHEAVGFLDKVYGTCDRIASMYNVTPLHRVNDTLLISSGVLEPCAEHASELAMVAIQLHEAIRSQFPEIVVVVKSGINSGTVVCGVVGNKVPMYAVFGDTVNVASRMYSTSEPGRTQISENTYRLLRKKRRIFNMVKRGPIEIKGKGTLNTYWLRGYKKYLGNVPTDRRLDGAPVSTYVNIPLPMRVNTLTAGDDDKHSSSSDDECSSFLSSAGGSPLVHLAKEYGEEINLEEQPRSILPFESSDDSNNCISMTYTKRRSRVKFSFQKPKSV
uniref:guanylate cyclase n=1 Tax=Trichuris muris TaxID=70415 RepID=A0A5S6R1K8_TRIMR